MIPQQKLRMRKQRIAASEASRYRLAHHHLIVCEALRRAQASADIGTAARTPHNKAATTYHPTDTTTPTHPSAHSTSFQQQTYPNCGCALENTYGYDF
mmetsp:Transcript_11749/g.32398  ORF Transcript_11749/g.32398 Transcript_11749/m.32398 type:complete len:98 (-) Transcript_11749:151-444(-)